MYRVLPLMSVLVAMARASPVVETRAGRVSGVNRVSLHQKKEYYTFLGIPYAEPPVGDLRFMAPKSKSPWIEVLAADKIKGACAQFNPNPTSDGEMGFFGTEDCLYIDVHTPSLDSDRYLPVIFFTHSVHFKRSLNNSKEWSADFFMEEDVLIVTVNHRLNSFGFLSYEDDLLPGNNGFRDIIMALEWVRDNIKVFGGNPDKVTFMGSQSGAAAADLLRYSKKAKGLFHGIIMHSGTGWSPLYLDKDPKKSALSLAEELGIKAGSSESLLNNIKKVKTKDVTEREFRVRQQENSREYQKGRIEFGPVVEHDHPAAIIRTLPEEATFRTDVPVMIGFDSREGIEFSFRYLRKPEFLTYAERDFMFLFPIRTKFYFKVLHQMYYDAINEIKDFYFEGGYVKVSSPGEYITYSGDILNMYQIDYTVRQYANRTNTPVYYYTFDYSGQLNGMKMKAMADATTYDGVWGASLGDELCYLFLCKSIKKNYARALKEKNNTDIKVLKRMIKMWTNFAKKGNPTPEDSNDDTLQGFKWEPVTESQKQLLEISNELKMRNHPAAGRIKFWDNFLKKYEILANDGVVRDEGVEDVVEIEDFEETEPKYQDSIRIFDGEKIVEYPVTVESHNTTVTFEYYEEDEYAQEDVDYGQEETYDNNYEFNSDYYYLERDEL